MNITRIKNRILLLVIAALVLTSVLPVVSLAAGFRLTVVPTQVVTQKTFNGEEVNICRVAQIRSGAYVLEPRFSATGLTVDTIFQYDHEKVAADLADFAVSENLAHTSGKTAQGKVTFSNLTNGLYLVYPAKDQLKSKTPFFAPFLVTVNGEDVTCYPKVPQDRPDPKPPTEPTKPQPTKPGPKLPQTGQLWWPVPVLAAMGTVCLAAGAVLRKKKQ